MPSKTTKKLSQIFGGLKGWPVNSYEGGFPVVQALKNPLALGSSTVHGAITLTTAVQKITSAITNPTTTTSYAPNETTGHEPTTSIHQNKSKPTSISAHQKTPSTPNGGTKHDRNAHNSPKSITPARITSSHQGKNQTQGSQP